MPKRELTQEQEDELEEDEIIEKWEETHPEATEEPQEKEPLFTEEQKQAWIDEAEKEEFQERKKELLEKLEKQIEESGKQDAQDVEERKQLTEQVKLSQMWQGILANKSWEKILRDYFRKIYGMTKGMCAKTVITITEKNGEMTFVSEFFDSNGNPITTEFSDEAKKAMEEDAKQ